jgi:uncharacterized protein (TIGR00730 family)
MSMPSEESARDNRQRLCVFCGSKHGTHVAYREAARQVGEVLARRGVGLVYGGGHVGLMGVLADAVLQVGGEVIGVIPRSMVDDELAHAGVTKLFVVSTMHERKALMAQKAQAFLALPGGLGTAEEFFEIVTWRQLKLHHKPVGLLNVNGYFDPLIAWIDRAFAEGFVAEKHRGLVQVGVDAEELIGRLLNTVPDASL